MTCTRLRLVAAAITLALGSFLPGVAAAQMCGNEIMPLRAEAEKQAVALKGAIEKKVAREQICALAKKFAAAELKFVKYLEDNQSWCQVPPEAVKQVKANHGNTANFSKKVCAVAEQQPQQPRGPGLSEALGTNRVPAGNNVKTGRGTFDTLTGNALTR